MEEIKFYKITIPLYVWRCPCGHYNESEKSPEPDGVVCCEECSLEFKQVAE